MLAALRGDAEIVRLLTDAGAELGLRGTGAPGFFGKTALELAVAAGHARAIDVLRERSVTWVLENLEERERGGGPQRDEARDRRALSLAVQ
jgi:ankyrin repeat protein